MNKSVLWLTCAILLHSARNLEAGGSGLNVAVVVNQNSSNSVQLGNYFCEKRQVPPQNLLRITWSGGNTEWALSDYTNTLLNPLLAMLSSRQLTNQIDCIVLSMDIPYRVNAGTNGQNSTTSSLFYGFKADTRDPFTCPLAVGSSNLYAGSEGIFRLTPPSSGASNSFLVTMITASNLALAKQIVDQGVSSDSTFPTQTVLLGKSTDVDRNVRFFSFDNAVFNTRLRGNYSALRTNIGNPPATSLLGYQNGVYSFTVQPGNFVPGAMADNLTSFGGMLFENNQSQTVLLAFLAGGAAGSYGTVLEPCSYLEKFPDPQDYFYQARGFGLAECYYQSLTNPYEGLVVGEPLAAPFARRATGDWVALANNAVLSGTTNLSFQFSAADPSLPLRHADLLADGTYLQSITNLPPQRSNILTVVLNGFPTNYTVASNATIRSVATALTGVLNNSTYTNLTKVRAITHGDRIELRSTDPAKTGTQVTLSASTTNGTGPLTTFVATSGSTFLDSIANGVLGCTITGVPDTNSFLQLTIIKTNLGIVNIAVTNTLPGVTMTQFGQQLVDLVNNTPQLQGSDGLDAEDFATVAVDRVQFDLRALAQGMAAAQIGVVISASSNFNIVPQGTNTLLSNLDDMQPRASLYVSAGATNFAFNFPLVTTNLANGWHELSVVAYEGTHVHTQARATRTVRIQNTFWQADITPLFGGSNSAVEATLQFVVNANTNAVLKTELYSTGGLLSVVSNQPSAIFAVPAINLDIGLHPFYALVTATDGTIVRTPTLWVRLVGIDEPFSLQFSATPPTLAWPAAAGRSYDVLSATNASGPYLLRNTIVPLTSLGQWIESNATPAQQFYRVRVTP